MSTINYYNKDIFIFSTDYQKIIAQNISSINDSINLPGLFKGLTGQAIFYYLQSNLTQNEEYQQKADHLIDVLYSKITSSNITPDFGSGLAGIGWGIEYMVKNRFIEANTNEVLEDFDNRIYKHIIFTDNIPLNVENGLLGYTIYILSRLESCNDSNLYYILENLLIEIVNKIVDLLNKQMINFKEPFTFYLFWELPIILILLGKISEKDIYTNKIYQFLKEITPLVCTLFPLLQCNRAYLLLGLHVINLHFNLPHWKEHSNILSSNISFKEIIEKEFYNKNIFLTDGLSGAFIVAKAVSKFDTPHKELFDQESWMRKIFESSIWNVLNKNEKQNSLSINPLSEFSWLLSVLTPNNQLKLF